jgi:peptide/nickel transport system substrate-binding protein
MIRKARRRESPTGEIDRLAVPLPDLAPMLRKNRNVMLDIADPLGNIGTVFLNHLYPPRHAPDIG